MCQNLSGHTNAIDRNIIFVSFQQLGVAELKTNNDLENLTQISKTWCSARTPINKLLYSLVSKHKFFMMKINVQLIYSSQTYEPSQEYLK